MMKGKVKWFSVEKGYGFIHGEDGADRFVHVKSVKGADLPAIGDMVGFDHKEGDRGPVAVNVVIEASCSNNANENNERVKCSSCHKMMVPRIIMGPAWLGDHRIPTRSVCPFCSEAYKEFDAPQAKTQNLASLIWLGFILFLVFLMF